MSKARDIKWALERLEACEERLRLNREAIRLCEQALSDEKVYGDPTVFINQKKRSEIKIKDILARKLSLYMQYGKMLPIQHDPRLH